MVFDLQLMSCFSFTLKWKKSSCLLFAGDEEIQVFANVKIYTYKEMRQATNDFSPANKVGEGGFGCVYKGRLKNGEVVAIKVLSSVPKHGVQFLNEIAMISNISHENLVSLCGCCMEGDRRILVYNYLENNSIAKMLFGGSDSKVKFNWKTRTKICVGVARGLAFLHEEVRPPIVHRDIKASNILLDKDLNPKISDFGLAKLLPSNLSYVSTRVAGTIGYLAPEYAIFGKLTRKADIYSYGVLLLEIISGKLNTNTNLPYEDQFLLERIWALYEKGELESIIDASLGSDLNTDEAHRFLLVGLLCTQDSPKLRPSMSTLVKMLTGEVDVMSLQITKPGMITDFMDVKVRKKGQQLPPNKLSPIVSPRPAFQL
ncbi:putative serine/threonine-protein kinase [Phalaenopsis equestris]|uniref:putative serine/threonine-protein kinase n=1 Tax=Phalaenopsis equestris TaxID=78828 RepID=UPI0009E4BCB3|nr:putative serine/threonine-protein kinase [Phalaenopsis equestris]